MKELDLYQFLHGNDVDLSWTGEMLLAWISHWDLLEFTKMITTTLGEGGLECRVQDNGMICIDLVPICDWYGIDPERISPNNE